MAKFIDLDTGLPALLNKVKAWVNSKLSTKQDTLTFDDVPTANSNNVVRSGGIKQAIDQVTPTIDANGKWVIGGVTTDKDAQGPMGNTVLVNENAQGIQALIVNNVADGGETDILSAEMGKVIRQNIMKIFNALGTYAFPEGKPVLNWGSTVINHSINVNGVTGGLTISDVEVDGTSVGSLPSQIVDGKSLSLKLNLPSNLYIYDAVAITMGGVDITDTTGVWDESTGKINIAAVTDDVVITATALTYVGYGEQNSPLVFNLDGKNRGGVAGHWTDLAGNVDFALTNCTENDDNVEFNGTSSKGVSSGSLNVRYDEGTIESIFDVSASDFPTNVQCILTNNINQGISIGLGKGAAIDPSKSLYCYVNSTGTVPNSGVLGLDNVIKTKQQVCFYKLHGYRNGVALTDASPNDGISFTIDSSTQLALGTRHRSSSDNYMKGKIFMVRVYNRELTDSERAQNYKVDKKRYNLS